MDSGEACFTFWRFRTVLPLNPFPTAPVSVPLTTLFKALRLAPPDLASCDMETALHSLDEACFQVNHVPESGLAVLLLPLELAVKLPSVSAAIEAVRTRAEGLPRSPLSLLVWRLLRKVARYLRRSLRLMTDPMNALPFDLVVTRVVTVYQGTFFAGILVLAGERHASNLQLTTPSLVHCRIHLPKSPGEESSLQFAGRRTSLDAVCSMFLDCRTLGPPRWLRSFRRIRARTKAYEDCVRTLKRHVGPGCVRRPKVRDKHLLMVDTVVNLARATQHIIDKNYCIRAQRFLDTLGISEDDAQRQMKHSLLLSVADYCSAWESRDLWRDVYVFLLKATYKSWSGAPAAT
ncbi:MAG: uncharacterized protein KVP18_001579 [Porospora cf. gigantea A]|nr:MAG: hypothetical protein KVP18_001579 [Porospora cf. gigantea A]